MIQQEKIWEVENENFNFKMVIDIYLVIALPTGIFTAAITTQILIKLSYFFIHGASLDLFSINYLKIFKGSVAGGIIGAIGCWYIYYQHYRKTNKKLSAPVPGGFCQILPKMPVPAPDYRHIAGIIQRL